jgi:ATP-dependent RNA helicase SUPV3L1/SUV3
MAEAPRPPVEKSAHEKSAERARERAQRDRLARQDRRERKEKAERRDERADVMARPGGGGRPRRRDKGDQVERAEREQYYAKPQGQRADRNKQPDPNSPFAKLAALKQQLEQSSKDT